MLEQSRELGLNDKYTDIAEELKPRLISNKSKETKLSNNQREDGGTAVNRYLTLL